MIAISRTYKIKQKCGDDLKIVSHFITEHQVTNSTWGGTVLPYWHYQPNHWKISPACRYKQDECSTLKTWKTTAQVSNVNKLILFIYFFQYGHIWRGLRNGRRWKFSEAESWVQYWQLQDISLWASPPHINNLHVPSLTLPSFSMESCLEMLFQS